MTTPDRPRGFEDRLLREFKKYFDERNQTMTDAEQTRGRTPWFTRGRKFSLAGAVGAVALGIGAIIALPALTASPAYAVEEKDNGEIKVEVYSPKEAEELEQTLAAHGIKAQVDFPPGGMMCDPDRYDAIEVPGDSGLKTVVELDDDAAIGAGVAIGFTVDPDDYPVDGDVTLVIEISKAFFEADNDNMLGTSLGAAKGAVGPCDPVGADEPPVDDAEADDGEKGTNDENDDGSKDED